jgi:2-polyprenyl-6-methoxyphenol hydroxylase-like FAD-dependent oxidoreductase
MSRPNSKAIIIGAGPGGLTAAIALRQAGFDAQVFERAERSREYGSGLTIWPNAMQALERLGIADRIRSIGLMSKGIAMRAWHGEYLFKVGGDDRSEEAAGIYGVAVHRAELLNELLRNFDGDVKFGAKCVGYRQQEDRVTALFEDGSEESGAILIGADGLNSAIRAQLCGKTKLRYAGYKVWRAVTRFELSDYTALNTMGRGAQFGLFPMTRKRVFWFASMNAPEGKTGVTGGEKQKLIAKFKDWHRPLGDVISATDESAIIQSDIYDRDPQRRWSQGRVTLLGDAAHPATPTLGQGACQAIEDALTLAKCLLEAGDLSSALQAYEARRFKRTTAITIQSRMMGHLGRWEKPGACWLRERLIKSIPSRTRIRQLNQLFKFEA